MIYAVQIMDAYGRIKIGCTTGQVGGRLTTLRTSCPYPLRFLGQLPGARPEERALHDRFAAYAVRGEWFEPAPEIIELFRSGDQRAEYYQFDAATAGSFVRILIEQEMYERIAGIAMTEGRSFRAIATELMGEALSARDKAK